MSLNNESKSSLDTFMEDLVRMNGEAMAALDEVPYQPIVYAVPKEWVESGKTLLENAVQFQPTLYGKISMLATQEGLQHQEVQLKADLEVAKREILKEFEELKKQVGSAKESISTDMSKEHTTAVNAIREEYETQQTKRNRLMWITISASAVLSGLVSGLCLLLAG
jgi:sensor c-di-GMP phosphodiesterase-like protein